MGEVVDQLVAAKDELTGVIVTSAKKTFFAGGDLEALSSATQADAPAVFQNVTEIKGQLRRLETLGKPVVAAMNGTALGGGLEIGLACHHRIGLDAPGVVYGLPEVTLGLLPGGGGVTRITRMLGIMNGFLNVLSQGQRHKPAKALEVGIVDELAATPEEMLDKAKAWIAANPEAEAALGPAEVPDPRRHALDARARGDAARVPGQPAQDAQGRADARPAQHPLGGRRGHPGRLRHGAAHREPLLHRAGVRPGQQEHDQGVLLRPAGDQQRWFTTRRLRALHAAQGRGARRRDDGRGHRLLVRPLGLGGRAQGRLAGGRGEGQGLLRGAGRQGRQTGAHHRREG